MNESSNTPPGRSRKLFFVLTSTGVALVLALGIEGFFFLRAKKRAGLIETREVTASNVVSVVSDKAMERANRPDAWDDPVLSPRRKRPRAPNDDFVDRIALETPAHVTASNAGASNEPGEHMQNTRIGLVRWGDTLWWKWTAPMSGPVTIDTSGSSFDTYLAIYTGTAVNALTLEAENDNASEVGVGDSAVTFNAREATEYEIQVGSVFTGGGRGSLTTKGTIQLNLVMPPSVTISSPFGGSIFPSGSNIAMDVTARSLAGTITNMSLYRGSTFLGSSSRPPPYSFSVSNAPVGTNSLYAVATDSIGQTGTSAVVRVLVASDGITITSPAEDAVFDNTKRIMVSAFAMLRTGSLTNVSFFVDGHLIGQKTNVPFNLVWSSIKSGAHQIGARAWDDSGKTYEATPVNIRVAQTFFPTGSVWRYLDNGSDHGTNWYALNFNDSSWKSGPGELGYGDGDEATVVEDNDTPGFNRRDTEHYITTYFRRAFVVTNIASYSHLLMRVKRDDGAVVYLNGREAARFNMNTGPVDYLTLARNAGDDGKIFVPATAPASFLVEGTNVVAVEIHQATADSTDISFEMDLAGIPVRR